MRERVPIGSTGEVKIPKKMAKGIKRRRKAFEKMVKLVETNYNNWRVFIPTIGKYCRFVLDEQTTGVRWGGYLYCNKKHVAEVMLKLNIKLPEKIEENG